MKKINFVLITLFFLIAYSYVIFSNEILLIYNKNFEEHRNFVRLLNSKLLQGGKNSLKIKILELNGEKDDEDKIAFYEKLDLKLIVTLGVYPTKIAINRFKDKTIIFTFVRYPECEGISMDKNIIYIPSHGSLESLNSVIECIMKDRRDYPSLKNIGVICSESLEPSIRPFIEKGKKLNLKMDLILLNEAPLLELVMQNVVMSYQAILLFPDSLTLNDYALRFILTRCYEKRVLTFTLDYKLVERGVFCGVYLENEEIASLIVKKIRELFDNKAENDNNNSKIEYSTVLNRNVSKYLGVEPNCGFTSFID